MKIVWITTWTRTCGIADYSQALWPAMTTALGRVGGKGVVISLDEFADPDKAVDKLKGEEADLIHFQHEYGIWGGKNPPGYTFPKWVKAIRQALPATKLVATAHTVIPENYRFPLKGRGLQIPIREAANRFLLPTLRKTWGPKTWGALDGVVVHSKFQMSTVARAGAKHVKTIPHFVPALSVAGTVARGPGPTGVSAASGSSAPRRSVLVFGFFTPEKGQDVAIEALARLPQNVQLTLAGGTRRQKDKDYQKHCLSRARELRLLERLDVTGFVERRLIDSYYAKADLVLAPFRETSGSGSIAHGFARGAAILASDLPLNAEIAERTPGALALFKSGDAADCARKIEELLGNAEKLDALRMASKTYAQACAPAPTAAQHVEFYREVLK